MPGLFSWKSRIRNRKTPDIDRSINNLNNEAFSTKDFKRAVRFNDTAGTPIAHHIGLKNQTQANWKYEDPAKKKNSFKCERFRSFLIEIVIVAPLATSAEFEEFREERQLTGPTISSSSTVIQTKPDNMVRSENESQSTGTLRRSDRSFGVVYLEVNEEVKRAVLPVSIQSMDTVRALFLRSFPQLTSQYLSQPRVKIYIQEPSKGQLFYELDDLSDIKDQAVLKLREQINGYQSPQPIRFTDHPPIEYLSESELEMMDYRGRMPQHRYNNHRSASALDGRIFGVGGAPKKLTRSPMVQRYDGYYDHYSSDTSSQDARSGSITPIVDKEARFRMETMERQLAGLSSLVHSALVSKGMSESSQRDMQELRRQIFALHPDVSSSSVLSTTDPSLPDSSSVNGETQRQLINLKRQANEIHNQLKQIRRNFEMSSQDAQNVLHNAFEKIQKHLINHMKILETSKYENFLKNERTDHITNINALQKSIQLFEEDVEDIRKLVLNTNRKLKITEVEAFTQSLTKIGRNAARLKTQFPELQRQIEANIKRNMEKVVEEERFLKEEPKQIDHCLHRCKALANMMVTMKKLAMLQDPDINNTYKYELNKTGSSTKTENGSPTGYPVIDPLTNRINERDEISVVSSGRTENLPVEFQREIEGPDQPPPVPPSPTNYNVPSTSEKGEPHVLDTILDELTNTMTRDQKAKSPNAMTKAAPPKPPERFSTPDARNRFTRSQIEEMQRRVMHSVSPIQGLAVQATYFANGRTPKEALVHSQSAPSTYSRQTNENNNTRH